MGTTSFSSSCLSHATSQPSMYGTAAKTSTLANAMIQMVTNRTRMSVRMVPNQRSSWLTSQSPQTAPTHLPHLKVKAFLRPITPLQSSPTRRQQTPVQTKFDFRLINGLGLSCITLSNHLSHRVSVCTLCTYLYGVTLSEPDNSIP